VAVSLVVVAAAVTDTPRAATRETAGIVETVSEEGNAESITPAAALRPAAPRRGAISRSPYARFGALACPGFL
jgi:hypothetical protein